MALRQSTTSRNLLLKGFTLIELLVSITIIGILAALLLSSLSIAKQKAQQIQCLNNLRQIEITRQLYSLDNNKLVANGFVANTNNVEEKFWVQGHLNNAITLDLTNSTLLFDNKFALFADYLPQSTIYKCPSDKEKFKLHGMDKTAPKNRTYGLNWHLGLVKEDYGIFENDIIKKEEGIISPVNTLTFIDTNPKSVCWPVFGIFPKERGRIFMYPSPLHNRAGNIAFADGRVQRRKWNDENTVNPTSILWHSHAQEMGENKDFEWIMSKKGKE